MSHIIQLRQRIKAVSTIQKTTHAMRLTSMSTHARLHKKKDFLERYRAELEQVQACVKTHVPVLPEETALPQKDLLIVVGSQKGLCGSFNTKLKRFFDEAHEQTRPGTRIIAIGKRIIEHLVPTYKIHYAFETFNPANFFAVTSELYEHITGPEQYTRVSIISNQPVSFFLQKPTQTYFDVPRIQRKKLHGSAAQTETDNAALFDVEGEIYLYDQHPRLLLRRIEKLLLRIKIEEILYKSLIAEQAARFLSMDASTTNAEKILEGMKRDYNKLRQATITRELTDLSSSLM